jgi:DNA-directed RNA polymerase subunit RPC12/RpoP
MRNSIKCPNCGGGISREESRIIDNTAYRKYKCVKCSYMFYTKESITDEAWETIKGFHRDFARSRRGENG